ncbi:MAG: hypothetical protein HOC74_28465, partial [Gemmatimonadetes bacterium]|nr:hypothetical protein [Gemmatimonadota bacterium]
YPGYLWLLLLLPAAGGLGAIFRAPLGGAITSVEVLYRQDFESDALIPCVISSIVAYSVYMGLVDPRTLGTGFGAMANTPLAALIIVTEMTGSYHLLPPLMLVSALALIFARDYSIYENQVESKFHSPAHLKDFTIDVLEKLKVSEIFPQLRNTSAAVVSNKIPVIGEDEESESKFLGYMTYQDLLRVYHEEVERLERRE